MSARTVRCGSGDALSLTGSKSATEGQGLRPTTRLGVNHIYGGQGLYVNLVSSGVTYVSEVFSFDVTVQNVTNLAMATHNGTTRADSGVQVFINSGPNASPAGTITVNNATGVGTFLTTNQSYYQYGGKIGGIDQGELGADGILSSTEVSSTKNWQFGVPATVTSFTFDVYVSTARPAGTVSTVAPQVSGISPATLVPGASATITGTNFNATFGNNTVTIGGQAATVTAGNTTSLTVTVPCVLSGSHPVYVTTGGARGSRFTHPLAVAQRTVAVGQALVLTSSTESACNELPSVGGAARYVVSVFNVNSSPSNNAPFQFSADNTAAAPAVSAGKVAIAATPPVRSTAERMSDAAHARLLDQNAQAYRRLRARFGAPGGVQVSRSIQSRVMQAPATRTFRVSDLNAAFPNDICNSYYVVSATLVYDNGKIAIYEDDATPNAFKNSVSTTMAANYVKIGDQFNADMEPIISTNFGDVLRRDAVLDNNGIVVALFTPRINNSFGGTAGFVVSCDQYPNDDVSSPAVGGPYTGSAGSTNGASNFGEVFYAYQPTDPGLAYSGNTATNWFRSIRSTFIHETKHLASYAARVANAASSFEDSWLEEGTARHSEELWMRNAVDLVAWKANTGYGTVGNPINVYCDVRTPDVFPECGNGKRPASIMFNHFSALHTFLSGGNPSLMSPFGPSPADNGSYFYGISWSLVRYSLDRYGVSDAAFLTALNNSTTTGAANLTARAGVSIDQLLGGWGLSLYADDHPSIVAPSADIQMPTWNLRSIYAGLNGDFGGPSFPLAYPLVPTAVSFGTSSPLVSATLRGGALKFFEFNGTQTAPQLLRLQASGGGTLPSDVRVAITRVQ